MTKRKHTIGSDPTKPVGNCNPPKATQFGQPDANPAGRKWKKADSPRYKLEQIIKMDQQEIQALIDDTTAPVFERQIAQVVAKCDWNQISQIIDQVYGPPVQRVESTITAPKPLIDIKTMRKQAREEAKQEQA